MLDLSNKAKNVSESATLALGAKVKEMIKNNEDVVNFTLGEPDFLTVKSAKEGGIYAINENFTKYDVASGNFELKKEIVKKLEEENNVKVGSENIVISNGAKQGIFNSLLATINEGDGVIIPTPCWVSYEEIVKIAGGKPIFLETKKENDFKLKLSDLKEIIESNQNVKMLILTNPNNPTGSLYSKEELLEICTYLTKEKIWILSDEIYERIVYESDFTSVLSLGEAIKENTILINGFSKSFSMTGWRLGYSVSCEKLAKSIGSIQSHITGHPCTISQMAGLYGLRFGREDVTAMKEEYKKRRDYIIEFLEDFNKESNLKLGYNYPRGAFYIFLDISNLKDKYEQNKSLSLEFSNELLKKEKVAVVPGIAFREDNFVRLSYATSMEDIKKGFNRIKKYINNL